MQAVPCLVIFCRRPTLGVGKQRLAASVGATAARDVAEALLHCALEDAEAWRGSVVLSPAESADAFWAATLLRREAAVLSQPQGNLGQRLQSVDVTLRGQGARELLFIGSDAPAHDAALYETAADALHATDVVLVPALDGGVTLMGSRQPWPMLTDLPWSTATLGTALSQCCVAAGMSAMALSSSFDVDELADLRRVTGALANDNRPARRTLCALLQSLRLQQAS